MICQSQIFWVGIYPALTYPNLSADGRPTHPQATALTLPQNAALTLPQTAALTLPQTAPTNLM